MNRFRIFTALFSTACWLLINVSAKAQQPQPPLIHIHVIKNIDGKITTKDTSFRPDPAKMRAMMKHRHFGGDSAMMHPRMKMKRPGADTAMAGRGWRHGHFKGADSIAVFVRVRLHNDSLIRTVTHITYFKPTPETTDRKTSDTVTRINILVRHGLNADNIPDIDFMQFMNPAEPGMGNEMGMNQTGINNRLYISDLNIFPNPNQGEFHLTFSLPDHGTLKVKVMDMQGKTVWNQELDDFGGTYDDHLNLTKEQKGIYILVIEQNNKTMHKKLVID